MALLCATIASWPVCVGSSGSPNLDSASWRSILTVHLEQNDLNWNGVDTRETPFQFFRLRSGGPDGIGDSASNFRLLDHQGVSRDLYYHQHLEAIVVLAAGTDLSALSPWTNTLAEIAKTYTNRVQTWILHSDPTAIRTNVFPEAKNLNLAFPILADRHGLAARSLGLNHAGEVAVVQPPIFTVAYRGLIASPVQTELLPASETYLGQALARLHSGLPITFRRTMAGEPVLNHVGAAVPNYSTEIAPIFYKHCAVCHHPGGVAPFAVTNHSVITNWSQSIKHALLSNRIPPWHADPEFGHFTNNLSLADDLRAALVRWIDSGSPRGTGPDPLAESPAPPA